jgi:hypothetical protein
MVAVESRYGLRIWDFFFIAHRRSVTFPGSKSPAPDQHQLWWRSAKDEAVVRQPVNVLTWLCRSCGELGGMTDSLRRLGGG